MNQVVSGPSTEKIVRNLLLFLLPAAFAIAFLLDGFYGYACNNAAQLSKSLGLSLEPPTTPDPRLTAAEAETLIGKIPLESTRRDAEERLGAPTIQRFTEGYYLGPGGHLRARYESDRLVALDWVNGVHSETDIALQRWIGFALTVFTAGLFVNLVRVASTRVVVADEGFRIRKGPVIPFSAVRQIYLDPDSTSGRVLIECVQEGRQGAFMLDAYHVKHLDQVIEAIQRVTGIEPKCPDSEPNDDIES